jgi:hypothetical protein
METDSIDKRELLKYVFQGDLMIRKKVFILILLAWVVICLCMTFLFCGKNYPLADEISYEMQSNPNWVVEFPYHYLYKAYKENGKYYISCQNMRHVDSTPKIIEISAKEYRYCAEIDPRRFDNYESYSGDQYNINIRYGKEVKEYSLNGWPSPLYELEELYETKVSLGEQETYRDNICGALTEFFDCSSIDAAHVTYPSEKHSKDDYYYGNVSSQDFDDAYCSLAIRHYSNQTLNGKLMKLYEEGTISKPNLKADYEKKKEVYEQATGKEFFEEQSPSSKAREFMVQNEIGALYGYTNKAYSDITYGTKGMIYYEIYVPDDHRSYTVTIKKPAFMPTWYLRTALNHILINEGNTIPWGKLYMFLFFFIPTVTGCLVLWIIYKKKMLLKHL